MKKLIILILLIGVLFAADDFQIETLEFGEIYHKVLEAPDNDGCDVYQVTIDKVKENVDFMVIAKGKGRSDPNIYLSAEKDACNKKNALAICNHFGIDICTLPQSQIKENKPIYIAITCIGSCSYSLRVLYQKELQMDIVDELQLYFDNRQKDDDAQYSQVISITTPDVIVEYETLNIEVTLVNQFELHEQFNVYLNEGDEIPTSSNYGAIGQDVWFGYKLITLRQGGKDAVKFKASTTYKVLIEAPSRSEVTIKTTAFGLRREINVWEGIDDIVEYEESKHYVLDFKNSPEFESNYESTIVFDLQPFSGNPDIYIHYGKQPLKKSDYQWSSTENGGEAIMITYEMKQKLNIKKEDEIYYILIYGTLPSAYTFIVYTDAQNETYLEPNVPNIGYIAKGELLNYIFLVTGDEIGKITLTLADSPLQGQTELFLKKCSGLMDFECRITESEVQKRKASNRGDTFVYDVSSGLKTVSFEYNPEECKLDQLEGEDQNLQFYFDYLCFYLAGVYANENNSGVEEINRYMLKMVIGNQHIPLMEGDMVQNWVEEGNYNYFIFIIPQFDNLVTKVEFVVDQIQGFVISLASQEEQWPTVENFEAQENIIITDDLVFTKQPLQGAYFVAVFGGTDGFYSITPLVTRKSEDEELINYQVLMENTVLSIKTDSKQSYFEIQLPEIFWQNNGGYQDDTNGITIPTQPSVNLPTITIQLNYEKQAGYYEMFISNTRKYGPPGLQNYQWKEDSGTLQIVPGDANYSNSYYILVNFIPMDKTNQDTSQFVISYQLDYGVQDIFLNLPVNNFINPKQTLHYRAEIQRGQDIFITKQSYVNETTLIVFISMDQSNTEPDKKNYQYILKKDSESVKINPEGSFKYQSLLEIAKKDCPFLLDKDSFEKCFIYLTLLTSEECFFNLLVGSHENYYELFDALPVNINFPSNKDQIHLYFYINKAESLEIFQHNYYAKVDLFVSVVDDQNQKKWKFPNRESFDFASREDSYTLSTSLMVSDEFLFKKHCASNCVLLVTAINSDELMQQYYNQVFSIQVSSQITRLKVTFFVNILKLITPYTSTVLPETINYYIFDNPSNENILISVTTFDYSYVQLFISKGTRSRPTLSEYDWTTQNGNGNEILISNSNSIDQFLNGTYVVGVYAMYYAKYQLQVIVGDFKLFRTFGYSPISTNLEKGQSAYFIYQLWNEQEFKVILSREGMATITIYKIESDSNIIDVIKNKQNYPKKTNALQANKDYLSVQKSDNLIFCSFCTYIIEVNAETECEISLFIEFADIPIQLTNNVAITNSVDFQVSHKYVYQSNQPFTIYFNLLSGKVKVYQKKDYDVSKEDFDSFYQYEDKQQGQIKVTGESEYGIQNLNFKIVYDSYCFLVIGESLSKYAIQVVGEDYHQNIKMGQINQFNLNPSMSEGFQVFVKETEGKSFLFQVVVSYDNNKPLFQNKEKMAQIDTYLQSFYQKYLFRPILEIKKDYAFNENKTSQNHTYFRPNSVKKYASENIYLYQVDDTSGLFIITIKNTQKAAVLDQLKFSGIITVNTDEIQTLIPSIPLLQNVEVGKVDYFELFVRQPSQVFIEVNQCYSLINVFATESYENLKNGVSELKYIQKFGKKTELLIQTDKIDTNLYIGVNGIQSLSKFAQYSIKTTIFDISMDLPLNKLVVGNQGTILWEENKDYLQIKFYAIESVKDLNDFQIIKVLYTISVSEKRELYDMNCFVKEQDSFDSSIKQFSIVTTGQNITSSYQKHHIDAKELPKAKYLFVNLMAKVTLKNNKDQEITTTLYYNEVELGNFSKLFEQPQIRRGRYFGLLFLTFFIALIAGVIYLYRKNKQLKAMQEFQKKYDVRLKYEMNDIRNLAPSQPQVSAETELQFRSLEEDKPQMK